MYTVRAGPYLERELLALGRALDQRHRSVCRGDGHNQPYAPVEDMHSTSLWWPWWSRRAACSGFVVSDGGSLPAVGLRAVLRFQGVAAADLTLKLPQDTIEACYGDAVGRPYRTIMAVAPVSGGKCRSL